MTEEHKVESNKWLWQPHRNGPIYIRFSFRDPEHEKKTVA